ncbi:hypothetical protein GCM10010371_20010 [Streptomyces subrutilus]|uniref:Uncharacterized protein n=1 Tax=Streptomyces subrutilus TaxID=36818 RepID=A0A918QQB7_9ACTN|nr:hypothetical protein GCM10010371_20010 [Streptomyces subrutilus]
MLPGQGYGMFPQRKEWAARAGRGRARGTRDGRSGRSSDPARGRTTALTPARRATAAEGVEPRGEVLERGHVGSLSAPPPSVNPSRRPRLTPPAPPATRHFPSIHLRRTAETSGLISQPRNAPATHPRTTPATAVNRAGPPRTTRPDRGPRFHPLFRAPSPLT